MKLPIRIIVLLLGNPAFQLLLGLFSIFLTFDQLERVAGLRAHRNILYLYFEHYGKFEHYEKHVPLHPMKSRSDSLVLRKTRLSVCTSISYRVDVRPTNLNFKYCTAAEPGINFDMEKDDEKKSNRKQKSRSDLLATLTGKDDESNPRKGDKRKSCFKKKNKPKHHPSLIPTSVARKSSVNANVNGGAQSRANAKEVQETGSDAKQKSASGSISIDNSNRQPTGSNKYLDKSENGRKRKRAVHLGGAPEPRKRPRDRAHQRSVQADESKDKKPAKASSATLTFTEKGTPNGSYKEYKRRRVINANDPRLKLLRPEWLPTNGGGRVLDIGCNDGALTLHVARRYSNAHISGVDIDELLIKRAEQRRKDVAYAASKKNKKGDSTAKEAGGGTFPNNLTFTVEDVCEIPSDAKDGDTSALKDSHYDLIMMMSVSKWLHMKSGDDGIKRIFGRVKDSLVPGGVFLLEPQPTKSYKAARRKGAVAPNLTVDKFKLKPEMFPKYLVEECGFERMEQLRDKLPKNTPFGTRPIMAFYKAKAEGADPDAEHCGSKDNNAT